MRENGCSNEALENAKCAETKVWPKDREETGEELLWEAALGEDESDDLEDDQQAVNDSPEYTSWLIWYGATTVDSISILYIYLLAHNTHRM